MAFLLASGCGGDSRPNPDARDGAGDGMGDGNASADRVDMRVDTSGTGGTGGGTAGTGGGTAGTGGGVDGGTAGSDGGTPTCSDGIKNSDETGVDCGGHCGKCGPGNPCLVNADCTFACKADKTCASCNVAADCSGPETECEHRSCTAGACGTTREAAGTVLTVQTTGDCKRRQCAADGTVATVNDDTDLPEDRNACTNDICTSGVMSHTMRPAGSNCGGANTCNASGQCVGCTVAADCPGTDNACRTRTCTTGGVCGYSFTAAGTKLVDPMARDCKGLQCDGAGNPQVINDNTDLPVDDNACTTDECSAGTPANRPVASGTSCGGSLVCDGASNCVECLNANTCPGTDTDCRTRSCVAGQCGNTNVAAGTLIPAQTPRDCKKNVCNGQGTSGPVSDDLDLPVDGNPCTQDVCTAGTPSNPFVTAGNSCGSNVICDGQGACVTCLTASSCPGTDDDCHTRTCINGACGISNKPAGTLVPDQTGNCKKTQCDGSGLSMIVNDDADLPVDGNACTADQCSAGVPSNPNLSAGTGCGTNNQMCNGSGACVGCLTAANCGTDMPCRTFACTNNTCVVNNVAAGTAPASLQTPRDCKKVTCDGAGQTQTVNDDTDLPVDPNACTKDLCNAGIPSNPPEDAGTTCSQSGGTRCNGSGTAPACVQCLTADQCPGTDNECHRRTCSAAGACGISNTADGTLVSGQTPQDCKKNICMNGNEVVANDDADVRVDGNGCTMDVCTNGTPSNPSLPMNAACSESGGTRCNGSTTAPACVQCLMDSHCGISTNVECQTFSCSAGQCSTNNAPNGTPVSDQTPGDCQKKVCNGSGGTAFAVDNTDVFVDGNACTSDLCSSGTPVNPSLPERTPCSQGSGTMCDGAATAPACVQCRVAGDCGATTFCKTFSCSAAGACSSSDTADGTALPGQDPGDCKKNVCMSGVAAVVNDDNDVDDDGNLCTGDVCSGGVSMHPNQPVGAPCGLNLMCDGSGSCVGCVMNSDCPMPPPENQNCQTRVCNQGSCGFSNAPVNTPATMQTAGNCKQNVCDGSGSVIEINDDADKPVDGNTCTDDVCSAGVPTNPPVAEGTACSGPNNATLCNATGSCVECLNASTCPGGPDTDCHVRTCNGGACGISFTAAGTATSTMPPQISGDCKQKQCDGSGGEQEVADESDDPAPTTVCATPMCMGTMAMNVNSAHGLACNDNNGRTCDGAGACIASFYVVRLNGTTNVGTAAFLEERKLDGTMVGTALALPTAASGANQGLTLSGSSTSEGSLSLSGDGRYLILAGYNAAIGASTGSANRVIGRIDAAGTINTTTFVTSATAFTGDNLRGATSQDGTGFWASGNASGAGANGGVWWIPLGGTGAVRILSSPGNTRWPHIYGGQLYVSTVVGASSPVAIGTGLPTTAGQTISVLPGLPATAGQASPFSYVFFDRNPNVAGFDLLYIADDGQQVAAVEGLQKWTLTQTGGTWTKVATFTNIPTPVLGFRGLTALETGSDITLITTTEENSVTRIIKFVDTGTGAPAGTVIGTAATGQGFRGVALAPHL